MKWFKMDTHASNDPKLEKLRIKYGVEGYGLYLYCLELIAREVTSSKYTFELEHDSELIGHNMKMDSRRVEEILNYCVNLNLFQINKNDVITCFALLKRLDDSTSKSAQIRKLIENGKIMESNSELVRKSPSDSEKVPLEQNRIEQNRTEQKTIEIKKEDKSSKANNKTKPIKYEHEEYDNLFFTQEEYDKLTGKFNNKEMDLILKKLSNYKHATNKTYKSDYKAIYTWVISAVEGN